MPVSATTPFSDGDEAHLPPYLRMRGGGGAQSSEASDRRPPQGPAQAPSPAATPRRPAQTSTKVVYLVNPSSGTAPLTAPSSPLTPAMVRQGNTAEPPMSNMTRPVITIFTTVPDDGDGDGDDAGKAAAPPPAAARAQGPPSSSGPRSAGSSFSRQANRHNHHNHIGRKNSGSFSTGGRHDPAALWATATSLPPLCHHALYGNGLEPRYAGNDSSSPSAAAASAGGGGGWPKLGRSFLNAPQLEPPGHGVPRWRAFSQASSADLGGSSRVSTGPAASPSPLAAGPRTRVTATPIVPINPYNETATRQMVARQLLQSYGPEAEQAADSSTSGGDPAAVAVTAPVEPTALTADESVASQDARRAEKERAHREREEAKQRKKEKVKRRQEKEREAEKTRVRVPPRGPALTKEQIIRVGATRLQQRLSALHLAVYRVKNDGNCQFRAIAQQLLGSEDYHDLIRAHVVSYMRRVRAEKFDIYFDSPAAADAYFAKIGRAGTWCDELTLRAAADSLFINVHVLSSAESRCYSCYQPDSDAPPAPTFLVDVAKIKERRRRERQFQQWQRRSFTVQMANGSLACPQAVGGAGPFGSGTFSTGSFGELYYPPPMSCPEGALGGSMVPNRSGLYPTHAELSEEDNEGGFGRSVAGMTGRTRNNDDDDIDANAIQQSLQHTLQHKRITASVPFFTQDGHLHHPTAAAPSGTVTPLAQSHHHTPTTAGSGSNGRLLVPVRSPPSRPGGSGSQQSSAGNSTSTPHSAVTGHGARFPSGAATATVASQVVVPDITADCVGDCTIEDRRVMGLSNFGVVTDDLVNIARYQAVRRPPQRLRRPAVDDDDHHGNAPATASQHPLAVGRAKSAAGGGNAPGAPHGDGQSFPIFPTVDGGQVMLLASTPASAGPSSFPMQAHLDAAAHTQSGDGACLRQSFATLQGCCAAPSLGGSFTTHPAPAPANTTAAAEEHTADDVVFVFEPRSKPIDVFVSYLYPVHYNALCIVEPDGDGNDNADGEAATARGAAPNYHSRDGSAPGCPHLGQAPLETDERPQFINASFLRTSFVASENL